MKLWQDYHRPRSLVEALHLLSNSPPPACVIAGGTDLMLDLQQGNHSPIQTLVDISGIPEMSCIEIRDGRLFIGAVATISQIAGSDLVLEHAEALVEACRLIGGPQVRNVATLGGNVAHALPAADGTISLMCLDAQAEVVDENGFRKVPLAEMYLGPGKSALETTKELLTGFYIPLKAAGQGSAFRRVMRAQGIALPILNMSAWLERDGELVQHARIVCGPAGPTPRRIPAAEQALLDKPVNDATIESALAAFLKSVSFRSSPHRATADYRRQLAGVLLEETLQAAWQRVGNLQVKSWKK